MDESRQWFYESRAPIEFFERVKEVKKQYSVERFFNQPGLSWIREAWTIGQFCKTLGADSCQLTKNDPPDGSFVYKGVYYPVEVVEALDPERRRGLEFRVGAPEAMHQDETYLARQETEFSNWVKSAAEKKLKKANKLSTGTVVLIHLSASIYDPPFGNIDYNCMRQKIFDIIPKPAGNIVDFVVLCNGKIFLRAGMFSKDA